MENGVRQTIASNTPSILTDTTGIPANPKRIAFSIQNVGTNPLFLLLVPPNSSATASSTVYHTVLKAGTGNDDGTGGSYSMRGNTHPDKQSSSVRCNSSTVVAVVYGSYRYS